MIFIAELSNFQKQINPCMKCAASTGREFGADVRDGYTLHGRLHVTQGTRYTMSVQSEREVRVHFTPFVSTLSARQ